MFEIALTDQGSQLFREFCQGAPGSPKILFREKICKC